MTQAPIASAVLGQPRRITGRHVLLALVAFFAVTIAVNVAFIYFAVTTFSGIETDNAYKRGLAYNQQHQLARAEATLGWRGTLTMEAGAPLLVLAATNGAPLNGAVVTAKAGRPSVDRFDRPLVFREQGSGRYLAEASALEQGTWVVAVEVRDASRVDGPAGLRLKERLWVSR